MTTIEFIINFVITWAWGLSVPLFIRYIMVMRPIEKTTSIFISFGMLLINIGIFTALQSQNKSHAVLLFVSFISYWIMSHGVKEESNKEKQYVTFDYAFIGKRKIIFILAVIISTVASIVFSKTTSNWFLIIPMVSSFASVLIIGKPDFIERPLPPVIWSFLLTPPILAISYFMVGIYASFTN